MTRRSSVLIWIATALFALESGSIGLFEGQADIGAPPIQGSAAFDPVKKDYRLTGAGVNMWGKSDQFHFVWRKLSGNVRITASLHFVGSSSTPHRKAGIMLRKSLDANAAYIDAVVHGSGLTALHSV